MTAIVKCDFCGQITDNPSAEVWIRLTGLEFIQHPQMSHTNRRSTGEVYPDESMKRDMCKPCLDKLLEPKEMKVITAEVAKDL